MKKTIIGLLILLSSNLFATSDHYSFVYIPIADPQEGGVIKLHKAIFFTWYAEPDFSLSAVTHPYIINTPHSNTQSGNQYQNMNINLAHINGLNIDLSKLYEKNCVVSIDTTQVTIQTLDSNDPEKGSVTQEHLDNVVKAVAKATRLNLVSNRLKCNVTISQK